MAKCGGLGNLLVKEHMHTFVNAGGDVRALDFRFNVGGRKIGAPFHGLKAFFTTAQLAPIDKACTQGPFLRRWRGGMQRLSRAPAHQLMHELCARLAFGLTCKPIMSAVAM